MKTNYYEATSLRPSRRGRIPAALLGALALLVAGVLIAGCGSSSESSTITVGNESKADNKLITAEEQTPKQPTTGPLASVPKVEPGKGSKPKNLETKDIIVGTGKEAKSGDNVYVDYVGGLWTTGKEFDSSFKRKTPFQFTVGTGQVIAGWDKGIVGMKEGGRRELKIPSQEAYGPLGNGTTIPKNEALIFIVDLLKVS